MSYKWDKEKITWLKDGEDFIVYPQYQPKTITVRGRDYPAIQTDKGLVAVFPSVFNDIADFLREKDFKEPMTFVMKRDDRNRLQVYKSQEDLSEFTGKE